MENQYKFDEGDFLISIVVPAYNEKEVLTELHRRLIRVMDDNVMNGEIVYVNDGSTDNTLEIMEKMSVEDGRVGVVDLSRNYGKEVAMTAGLDFASGDAVIIIDADLQDPPELIPELVRHWKDGYDVVYAKRTSREGETAFKKMTSHLFYRFIQKISRIKIPEDTGDFRLLSRRAVDSLKQLREHHRFMKGLYSWIGYPQKPVLYNRDPRYAGQTKWNYWRLWNFAIEGITSFTIGPLKLAGYLGLCITVISFFYGFLLIGKTLLYGGPLLGYPSLMVVILFLGGVQLTSIGIVGEYLGRQFDESKGRPLYFINKFKPASTQRCRNETKPL